MTRLNSLIFSTWKHTMEDFLYCKDLYKPIRLAEKPSDILDEDWDVEHRKVIAYMRRWMNANLNKHIYDGTKEDVVCKNLENLFSMKVFGNKTTLIRRFVILKYKDRNNMVEHIGFFFRVL